MKNIITLQGYYDIFDDEPQLKESYLNGINKQVLIDYAMNYCSLSTIMGSDVNKILWPFFNTNDINTKFYKNLIIKISYIVRKGNGFPKILNVRSSLKFFELVQGREQLTYTNFSEQEIRQKLFKVYLLLNSENKSVSNRKNLNEQIVETALTFSIYSNVNCYFLRITELIKSCFFLEYCKEHIPFHFNVFLKNYGIDKWQDYTLYLYQIGKIILDKNIEEPVKIISIPIDDLDYAKKTAFFDKFCMQEIYQNDEDFTRIKSHPVIKNDKTAEYRIVFEQFFIEKTYKSLYFTFKEINDSFVGLDNYINKDQFRSDIGLKFSEKTLMNRILKDALGNKYKQLGYEKLKRDGNPDYYIRDGKHILLFECKDNLIGKKVIENADIEKFIIELKHLFLNNKNGKPKAIKQIINNIVTIRKGEFIEDKGIDTNNNVIYPILITHNSILSLPGVNILIDEWFFNELDLLKVDKKNIKHLTIIDINTFILFQGLISKKGNTIRELIDLYWKNYTRIENKKYEKVEDVVDEFRIKYQSFNDFVENRYEVNSYIMKKLLKYDQYFS